ncbi:MAG: hypothetical protein PVF29_03605, partial [Desulfobacterales bacterium]
RAFELAQKAIALDESLPAGYTILGEIYLHKKQHARAIAAQEKAIALSPNDAEGIASLAGILTWARRPQETVELIKRAMRLNRELSEAADYVRTILPQPLTEGTIRTDWRFVPSTSLGGDAFGYHWVDKDHFAIYLIDVSGHGVGAALLVAKTMS